MPTTLLAVDEEERKARLSELARAGRRSKEWATRRDALVARASNDGLSLRQIAAAIGLSQAGVARIVKRENGKPER